MKKLLNSLLMAGLIGILFACTGGHESTGAKKPDIQPVQKKTEKVQPIAIQEEVKKPEYVVTGVRDPFQPYEGINPSGAAGDLSKIDPLQQLSLSQIYLVGVITGTKNKALIQDSSGLGYIIGEGMLIGENNGIITRITKEGITIKQHFKDYMGRVNTREVVLSLKKEEGVK